MTIDFINRRFYAVETRKFSLEKKSRSDFEWMNFYILYVMNTGRQVTKQFQQ